MSEQENSKPELQEEELFTEEGFPSGALVEEVYKHMALKYGAEKLTPTSKNIFEVFDEEQVAEKNKK